MMRKLTRDRNSEHNEITFVIGFPRNQEQRDQSRAAIQGNSSRIRWRKGSATAEAASAKLRRRHNDRGHGQTPGDVVTCDGVGHPTWNSEAMAGGGDLEVPPGHALRALAPLDRLLLPPFLPLPHHGIMPAGEVWSALQEVFVFWETVYGMPSVDVSGGLSRWIRSSITSSPTYQTAMMNHFTRESIRKNHSSPRDRQLSLQFYEMAIVSVREYMQDPATALSDCSIFAVANLTMHPPLIKIKRQNFGGPRPSQGPLKSLQYLDLYGGPLGVVSMHRQGMLKMIELRGGIREAGLAAVAFPLSQVEVWSGARYLHCPKLEYYPIEWGMDLSASLSANRRCDHPLRRLGLGFCALLRLNCGDFCQQVRSSLDLLALYSLGVDDYVSQRPQQKARKTLTDERNFVQHTLLSLCPEEGETDDTPENAVARACHQAGLIYSFCCVFPIAESPFARLTHQLRQAFGAAGFVSQWNQVPELLTWVAMMWAIAAVGMPERALATRLLLHCVNRLHVDSWERLQALLSNFLWFPDTNDIDGVEIWDELELIGLQRGPHRIEEIE